MLAGRHHLVTSTAAPDRDEARYLGLELTSLSDGSVARYSGRGPTLARRTTPRRILRASTHVDALSRRDQAAIVIISGIWLACVAVFWMWWVEPAHREGMLGLVVNSAVLAYLIGFPGFFVVSANHLRKVNPEIAVPALRTAFVVAHAPSEPWPVVEATLEAMLAQDYPLPYETWLCSEQPTREMINWCVARNVGVCTRSSQPDYHRDRWPRRTRCKEGNLAYFYDRWGYRCYDVVVQLDCDHVPAPGYLANMVRPFSDPAIGYVAAPSVCDANAALSWAARGRLHKEATFHGPFQLGHSGYGPLCIGSHYAVRTQALRQIGGIGPDLAEDFSTTFLLNAAGWLGAFAIDAEAHGDGPNTFAAMTVQEFQWARSLATILLWLVPRNARHLRWRLRFRFAWALSYYFLLTGATAAGLALAPVAAVTGLPWINVNYFAFVAHVWAISLCLIAIVALLRRRGLLRPPRAPLISWENWLYSLTRWPFVGLGILAAVLEIVRRKPVSFKVTPKSAAGLEPLPARLVVPFAAISGLSAAAAIFAEHASTAAVGYVFLSTLAGVTYAIVATLIPLLHVREAAASAHATFMQAIRATARAPLMLASCSLALAGTAAALYPTYAIKTLGW